MTERYSKWLRLSALASYAAAVFMIAGGNYWIGIAFIGAGASLISASDKKTRAKKFEK